MAASFGVNSILCKLLFDGEWDMYSKVNLVQLALSGSIRLSFTDKSDKREKQDSLYFITDEVFNTFMVYYIWTDGNDSCGNILEYFSEWWKNNKLLVPSSDEISLSAIHSAIFNRLERTKIKDMIDNILAIKNTITDYFGIDRPASGGHEITSIREQFYQSLQESLIKVRESLSDSQMSHEIKGIFGKNSNTPVHFNFFNEANKKNENNKLRYRRIESLVGFLVLIRGLYESIMCKIKPQEGKTIFVLRDNQGRIVFSNLSSDSILLDPLRGTFFTSEIFTDYYINLRLAFYKSMWHLAGILKVWGVIHLCQKQNELKNGEGIFLQSINMGGHCPE